MTILRRFPQLYRTIAVMILNAGVLFALLNGVLFLVYRNQDRQGGKELRMVGKYGMPLLLKTYAGWTEPDLRVLLRETWTRTYTFEPFMQFKERPFAGRYVNVERGGFRRTASQGPWPLQRDTFNIFLIGGSTTFGYGVPDDQTIASHLQRRLNGVLGDRVRVYNFGRGHYYSTQERILFEQLLVAGHAPDLAIFIDGLNEFYHERDEPFQSDELKRATEGRPPYGELIKRVPVGRWMLSLLEARLLRRAEAGRPSVPSPATSAFVKAQDPHGIYNDSALLDVITSRYLANRKIAEATAAEYGVKILFVWQPVPTYCYDLNRHMMAGMNKDFGEIYYCRYGYPLLLDRIRASPPISNFLWCADMQTNLEDRILYVDKCHYSAFMCDQVAVRIADDIVRKGLVPPP